MLCISEIEDLLIKQKGATNTENSAVKKLVMTIQKCASKTEI